MRAMIEIYCCNVAFSADRSFAAPPLTLPLPLKGERENLGYHMR